MPWGSDIQTIIRELCASIAFVDPCSRASTTFAQFSPAAHAQLAGQNIFLAALKARQEALGANRVAGLPFVPDAVLKQLNTVDTASYNINENLVVRNTAGYTEIHSYQHANAGGSWNR